MSLEKFKEEFKRLISGNHPDSIIEALYKSNIDDWIPIEQAPKDTPIILLPEKEYGDIPVVGILIVNKSYNNFYLISEKGSIIETYEGYEYIITPTHFKYLN